MNVHDTSWYYRFWWYCVHERACMCMVLQCIACFVAAKLKTLLQSLAYSCLKANNAIHMHMPRFERHFSRPPQIISISMILIDSVWLPIILNAKKDHHVPSWRTNWSIQANLNGFHTASVFFKHYLTSSILQVIGSSSDAFATNLAWSELRDFLCICQMRARANHMPAYAAWSCIDRCGKVTLHSRISHGLPPSQSPVAC